MLLLLPYGHEDMTLRRVPVITAAIMAACLLVQIGVAWRGEPNRAVMARLRIEAIQMILEHPHLTVSPAAEKALLEGFEFAREYRAALAEGRQAAARYGGDREAARREQHGEGGYAPAIQKLSQEGGYLRRVELDGAGAASVTFPRPSEAAIFAHLDRLSPDEALEEQATLDAALNRFQDLMQQDVLLRFGYLPSSGASVRLLTHMFLHAGWLHLIGNMLFLFVVGLSMEDRWGRFLFPAFYLTAGVVAALVNGAAGHGPKNLVMVGASGAISGVMGAFLVLFWRRKIKILWVAMMGLRPRFGTMAWPAYVAGPAWLLQQLFMSAMNLKHDHVAYAAHIGGFLFGAAVAAVVQASGFERRVIARRLEAKEVVYERSPEVERAEALLAAGNVEDADRAVEALLRSAPEREDALALRLEARTRLGQHGAAWEALSFALAALARQKAAGPARVLWDAWSGRLGRQGLGIDAWMRVAQSLRVVGLGEAAAAEYEAILKAHGVAPGTLPAVIAYAELVATVGGREKVAVGALQRARSVAGADPAWAQRIDGSLRRIEAAAQDKAAAEARAAEEKAAEEKAAEEKAAEEKAAAEKAAAEPKAATEPKAAAEPKAADPQP